VTAWPVKAGGGSKGRGEPVPAHQMAEEIRQLIPAEATVVFVSGDFNVVHAGHQRILNFARECGDFLVVGVNADGLGNTFIAEEVRRAGVAALSVVDHAFILHQPPAALVAALQPAVVVKGLEHRDRFNPEQQVVDGYGGQLLFCSGQSTMTSLELLRRELIDRDFSPIHKPRDYLQRHGLKLDHLATVVHRFSHLRLVVVGDLIVDEYIDCEPLGMSREDTTLVVSPLMAESFVGGAGIVAAHARQLGASVAYFGVVAEDAAAEFAAGRLGEYGVAFELFSEQGRPTTLKQRFRAGNKTLLRVSHLRQHDIGEPLVSQMAEAIEAALDGADLLIFSDFNYGALPQGLVQRLNDYCRARGIPMVADSQASSQIGDVSRFYGMELLTPTEYEARLALSDTRNGLVVLAERLSRKAAARHLILTLGANGVLVYSPGYSPQLVDQLPAFNAAPRDVAGAGDCLLTCTAMALVAGAEIWPAAYLGSLAAACQVSRTGNTPLTAEEVLTELAR